MDDDPVAEDAIRAVVTRLARPHKTGGAVIERAAILAEGSDSTAIIEWIVAHEGTPVALAAPNASRGLHGARDSVTRAPVQYLLPAGALQI